MNPFLQKCKHAPSTKKGGFPKWGMPLYIPLQLHLLLKQMFSILESVAFDTGYAGSAGLVPQSWVNGNGTSYIYYGAGEFDGQGSGDDFWGTVCDLIVILISRMIVLNSTYQRHLCVFCYCVMLSTVDVYPCLFLQLYNPPFGFVNNADGGRSHTYADYRQE